MDAFSFWVGAASGAALICVISGFVVLIQDRRRTRKEAAKPLLGVVQPKDQS